MYSVTQRIKQVKQPYGGYINKKLFNINYFDGKILKVEEENIPPTTVGLVVDYLTRFYFEKNIYKVFDISLRGFNLNDEFEKKLYNQLVYLLKIVKNDSINSNNLIKIACLVAPYDALYRAGTPAHQIASKTPDQKTISHIKTMVNRTINLLKNKKQLSTNITFKGGYTDLIATGDGDFATEDTIYDLKVSKQDLNSKQTLQIYLYYLLAKRSKQDKYKNIDKIAIYNPRLNVEYVCQIKDISEEVEKNVKYHVMGIRESVE